MTRPSDVARRAASDADELPWPRAVLVAQGRRLPRPVMPKPIPGRVPARLRRLRGVERDAVVVGEERGA